MGPSERVTVTNMDQYNSILMIESLSPDHNGNYSCVARNVAAEVSHMQRLVVHGNPPLGPLQFARRPPDRPNFACACVCPLRACESRRLGSKMDAARVKVARRYRHQGYCCIPHFARMWETMSETIQRREREGTPFNVCLAMRFRAHPRRDLADSSRHQGT